jgi:ABC-2 type transport system ATP-binding protein
MEKQFLKVRGLKKYYSKSKLWAVNGIDLDVEKGSLTGLLGPNGAGKTTTLEVLEGLKEPTDGSVLYHEKYTPKQFRKNMGIQLQTSQFPDFLKVKEVIWLYEELFSTKSKTADLIDALKISDFIDREARKLSGGQRQRLMLLLALLPEPEIVFLDEPTTGLDPQSRRDLRQWVLSIKKKVTLLLTTHDMVEAQLLCDDLYIVDRGEVVSHGTPKELIAKLTDYTVVKITKSEDNMRKLEKLNIDFVPQDTELDIRTQNHEQLLKTLVSEDFDIRQLNIQPATLEDVFIKIAGRELQEGEL